MIIQGGDERIKHEYLGRLTEEPIISVSIYNFDLAYTHYQYILKSISIIPISRASDDPRFLTHCRLWFTTVVVLCLLTFASMALNIILICTKCKEKSQDTPRLKHTNYKSVYQTPRAVRDSFSSSADDECSDDSFENIALRQMRPSTSGEMTRLTPMDATDTVELSKPESDSNLRCMPEL